MDELSPAFHADAVIGAGNIAHRVLATGSPLQGQCGECEFIAGVQVELEIVLARGCSIPKIFFLLPIAFSAAGSKQITHHDDYMVIVLNSVHMFIGGVVFSLSFSMSANKFRSKPARSAASTFMNIFYYVAMAIGMAISFPLSR